jgi:hypothetical protein
MAAIPIGYCSAQELDSELKRVKRPSRPTQSAASDSELEWEAHHSMSTVLVVVHLHSFRARTGTRELGQENRPCD